MKVREASKIVPIQGIENEPLQILKLCGGYYECPKNSNGQRLGPLVGYAGKYNAPDGTKKQWVGDVYANFAKAEEYPHVMDHYAEGMEPQLSSVLPFIEVFCGAPIGGYSFARALGMEYDRRVIFAEKKVTALATAEAREQSALAFIRHEVKAGDAVAIVEDVCNNFATTAELITLIEQAGGKAVAIVCILNRSLTVYKSYQTAGGLTLPVVWLVGRRIHEYTQDDLEVAEDVAAGNVVWKPKDEWPRLMAAMEQVD